MEEAPRELLATRLIFVYTGEALAASGDPLSLHEQRVDAPAVVARKSNLNLAARLVRDYLAASPEAAEARVVPEGPKDTAAGIQAPLEETLGPLSMDATLWQGVLPEITLVDSDGNTVRAATELQDYRAEYACRYVLAHFQENVNRDKMAEMVNLSPGYFSNLFRAEVGMSFSDYLIQVRIENAKRLLRRFDLSVEAISKQCGFNSLAHFSRTFKDRCGLSPLKYRKSPNNMV